MRCVAHLENEAVVQFLLFAGALPIVFKVAPLEASEQAHHLIHANDVAPPQFPGEGRYGGGMFVFFGESVKK